MDRHLALHLGGAIGAVAVVCALPMAAVAAGRGWALVLWVFAVAIPALLVTFVMKLLRWLRAPIAFRIPLTVGQQRSPRVAVRNLHTAGQASMRAAIDLVLFRPLMRATPTARKLSPALDHGTVRSLWLAAVCFHASLAAILFRHLRILIEPVPRALVWFDALDAIGEATLPRVHATSALFLVALSFLLGRRLCLPRLRYISLAADYFPLLLLIAIAVTGLLTRHVFRVDALAVKQMIVDLSRGQLTAFSPAGTCLVTHLVLVGALLVHLPQSKLMHMPGALLSPTLTLANNTRARRHVNPNNPNVEVLHYADYEDAFRDPMVAAGLPVERK
jgi:nitrate reductase gamma subunit